MNWQNDKKCQEVKYVKGKRLIVALTLPNYQSVD